MKPGQRQRRRLKKFGEQDGICLYCEGQMTLVIFAEGIAPSPAAATLEHIHQAAYGGTYASENTKAACAGCNEFRPDGLSSDDYLVLRRRLLPVWEACSWPQRPIRQMLARTARQARAALEGLAA